MKIGFLFRLLFLVFPFYSIAYATTEEEIIEDITSCENPEYEIKAILYGNGPSEFINTKLLEEWGYEIKINKDDEFNLVNYLIKNSEIHPVNDEYPLQGILSNILTRITVNCDSEKYNLYFNFTEQSISESIVSFGILYYNNDKYLFFYSLEPLTLQMKGVNGFFSAKYKFETIEHHFQIMNSKFKRPKNK